MSTPSGRNEHDDVVSAYAPKHIREKASERQIADDAPLSPAATAHAGEAAAERLLQPDEATSLAPDQAAPSAPRESKGNEKPKDHAKDNPKNDNKNDKKNDKKDVDLQRLETSLRWLQQRQAAAMRLPPAPTLSMSGSRASDGAPRARGRERIAEAMRPPPRSLEPERMAPPPAGSERSPNTMLFVSIACIIMAAVVYYFLETTGEPPSLASASEPQMDSVAPPPAPPSAEPERSAASAPAPSRIADGGDADTARAQNALRRHALLQAADASAQQPANTATALAESPPQQTASATPRETVPAPAPTAAAAGAASAATAARTLGTDEIALLIEQGEKYIAVGDVVAARTIFQRAAEAGDATAALALAATYDPIVLAKLGVMGMGADVEKARAWYQMAESYGSAEASQRLLVLNKR
jgi:hypothetical protein